jgi:hypothetical protein
MQRKLRKYIEKIIPLTEDEFALVYSNFTQKKIKTHQFLIQKGDPQLLECPEDREVLCFSFDDYKISNINLNRDLHRYFNKHVLLT